MYLFGEGDDKELYSIPVSKDIEDRPDPNLFVEVDFAMGKLTKTTMIQEETAITLLNYQKVLKYLLQKCRFNVPRKKRLAKRSIYQYRGRAGHVQDEVWYAVQNER